MAVYPTLLQSKERLEIVCVRDYCSLAVNKPGQSLANLKRACEQICLKYVYLHICILIPLKGIITVQYLLGFRQRRPPMQLHGCCSLFQAQVNQEKNLLMCLGHEVQWFKVPAPIPIPIEHELTENQKKLVAKEETVRLASLARLAYFDSKKKGHIFQNLSRAERS